MSLRAVLDAAVKRKIPSPRRESNPRTPIVRPICDSKILMQIQILFPLSIRVYSAHSSYKRVEYCPMQIRFNACLNTKRTHITV
jgi:hypothetical protein